MGSSVPNHAPWVDAFGNPLRLILTPGQKSDIAQGESLISGYQAQQVIADKGYDGDCFVLFIEENGTQAVIPSRSNGLTAYHLLYLQPSLAYIYIVNYSKSLLINDRALPINSLNRELP